jgi:hydrogenase nickel incorporation protein HypA/HybF
MHELSIVMGIVDIAASAVQKAGARTVDSIELEIGELAGIEMDALYFAWDAAIKNTVLSGAKRDIHFLPGKANCLDCGEVFDMHQLYDPCPKCNNYLNEIIQGRELKVKALTVS